MPEPARPARRAKMSLAQLSPPGSIDRLLAEDHAHVEQIFVAMEAGEGDRQVQGEKLSFLVAAHVAGEEQVLYPALAKHVDASLADTARDEHAVVKKALVVLDENEPGSKEYEEALVEIITDIRGHAMSEELEWLPALRTKVGDAEMLALGEKLLAVKRKAPSHAHPSLPDGKLGEKLTAPVAALKDKRKDRRSGAKDRLMTDASGRLTAEAQDVIDAFSKLHPLPVELLTPKLARHQPTAADAVQALLEERGESTDPEPVELVTERKVPGRDDAEVNVRVYVPEAREDVTGRTGLPVIVYARGGGWVIADIDVYDATPRALANAAGAIVVSVDYRKAPEHPFPAAHDDVLAVTSWVLANAAELGGDAQRVAILGESAGGNMAASSVIALKRAGEALPAATVLVYPVTSLSNDWTSFTDNADAVPLNSAMIGWFGVHTFGGDTPPDDRVELMDVPQADLRGLPPTLVVLAERDPLRDEGEAFAKNLRRAGVKTEVIEYLGVPHEFFGMGAVLDSAVDAVDAAANHIRAAFGLRPAPLRRKVPVTR